MNPAEWEGYRALVPREIDPLYRLVVDADDGNDISLWGLAIPQVQSAD